MTTFSYKYVSITQQCDPLDVGTDVLNQNIGLLWIPSLVGHDESWEDTQQHNLSLFTSHTVI